MLLTMRFTPMAFLQNCVVLALVIRIRGDSYCTDSEGMRLTLLAAHMHNAI